MLFGGGGGREKEREGNINVRNIDWLPFCAHPDLGLNPQPRHVLKFEPMTFQLVG